ncbi:MAG: hypothetical protein HC918_11305 [Oscillatoriales cyanobacterium SM2_1_8]|nr:hypothetical protein [Oscillatoriales cyanobacterium SM2_1_8]
MTSEGFGTAPGADDGGLSLDEALALLDGLLEKPLNHVEELVLRWTWGGRTYAEIAERSGYDSSYIRDVGYRLWRKVSQAVSEKTTKHNIQVVLRQQSLRQQQGKLPKAAMWWGEMPEIRGFQGRQEELTALAAGVVGDRWRLVGLLGAIGTGKSWLAAALAEKLANAFDTVIWYSLSPSLTAEELWQDWQETIGQGETGIRGILAGLGRRRVLWVLDGWEHLLAPGEIGRYRPGYERCGELLNRLSHSRHNSCVVVASQERPPELPSPRLTEISTVRSHEVLGLPPALCALWIPAHLQTLGLAERWQGHPGLVQAAVQSLAALITAEAATILAEAELLGSLRSLCDRQGRRLSPLERQVVSALVNLSHPVAFAELYEALGERLPRGRVLEALAALQDRHLLGRQEGKFAVPAWIVPYFRETGWAEEGGSPRRHDFPQSA